MSILDDIANPKVPNFLEGLRTVENIETARLNRRIAEVQAGQMLQNMQIRAQQLQQQQAGTQVIRGFLQQPQQAQQPQQKPTTAPMGGIGPPTATGEVAPAPAPATGVKPVDKSAMEPILTPLQALPVEQIQRSDNLRQLADTLAALPGNEKRAQMYYDLANKAYDREKALTKQQRLESEQVMELAGNNAYQIAKLEDAGNDEQAKVLYNQMRDFFLTDTRFANNAEVQQFFQQFPDYQPGLGKFIYTSTRYTQEARRELQQARKPMSAATTYTKTTEDGYIGVYDKGTNEFIKYLTDQDGNPMKAFAAKKAEDVQKRFEERQQRDKEKADVTAAKFDVKSTDDIIKFKMKEEKDLKEIQSSLQRAIKLSQEAQKNPNIAPLASKLMNQSMSKWENTSVRAYAELEKFKNPGGIFDRVAGTISQFYAGDMTTDQWLMAIDTAQTLLNTMVNPALSDMNSYWRSIASERDLDPDQVARYQTKEDVAKDYQNGVITRQQAEQILAKPRFKWQTPTP